MHSRKTNVPTVRPFRKPVCQALAFVLVSVATAFTVTDLTAQQARAFDAKKITRLVAHGDFDAAIVAADDAIAHYQHELATGRNNGWRVLTSANVFYYMCAKAQLLALRGDFTEANKITSNAEEYAIAEQWGVSIDWKVVMSATRGFILEKRRSYDQAVKAYQNPPSDYGYARMALLAFSRNEEEKARDLAGKAGVSPTAFLVLGRVAERKRDIIKARDWYDQAWRQLEKSTRYVTNGGDNRFLPIYFCDGPGIDEAHKRLSK